MVIMSATCRLIAFVCNYARVHNAIIIIEHLLLIIYIYAYTFIYIYLYIITES